MKVIPRASDQFHPSKKSADQQVKFTNADDNSIQTDSHSNCSFSSSGPEVQFWNDEKVIFLHFWPTGQFTLYFLCPTGQLFFV